MPGQWSKFIRRALVMTPTQVQRWRAWGSSLILHTVVLLCLALIVRPGLHREWFPTIETVIDLPKEGSEPFLPSVDSVEFLSQSGSPAAGPKLEDLLAAAPIGAGLNLPVIVGSLSGDLGEGGVGGSGGGGGNGIGDKIGSEKGVGFFGTRGTATAVVFVVDMSGSMENGRFVRAQQELIKSIHRLNATQYFYVVFFTRKAVPLFFPSPAKDLVRATPLMKRKATRWITERRTGAGTDPEEALVLALSLQPDVIYFLTDGEFSEQCRDIVKEKNDFGTVINTIALQSQEGAPLLRQIARENNGTFKLIK